MKQLLMMLVAIGFLISCSQNEDPTEVQVERPAVLKEMIDLSEDNSINRFNIDWEVTREMVNQTFDEEGFEEAVRELLRIMDTNHSFYSANNIFIYESVISCTPSNYTFNSFSPSIGYVKVGSFTGSTTQAQRFADDIQETLQLGIDDGKDRWVVDLSGNGGGNMYPMIAGLGPLLGNNILGFFIGPDEQETIWGFQEGASYVTTASNPITTLTNPMDIIDPETKVAVIIDNITASSGEATAISFIGRPNTRFFGTASCGLSTANRTYQLSNGATFVLTVSTMADREKNSFGGQIQPDETFDNAEDLQARVEEWLLEE